MHKPPTARLVLRSLSQLQLQVFAASGLPTMSTLAARLALGLRPSLYSLKFTHGPPTEMHGGAAQRLQLAQREFAHNGTCVAKDIRIR